ncbi:hypothetical protein J7384_17320 [Endozoicomonas sp. G2_1]|uniref:hypothetical protein n=1 Tax=Endozoicomonas sp. G2_1 TaxID=2821091 RepID=UPI001ADD4A97|nr:hypothetical protein [Endozoicomonas sp. G2_1]MBO9492126.1 hypothetical protein [Endozoicomonas sp. G2_1]
MTITEIAAQLDITRTDGELFDCLQTLVCNGHVESSERRTCTRSKTQKITWQATPYGTRFFEIFEID